MFTPRLLLQELTRHRNRWSCKHRFDVHRMWLTFFSRSQCIQRPCCDSKCRTTALAATVTAAAATAAVTAAATASCQRRYRCWQRRAVLGGGANGCGCSGGGGGRTCISARRNSRPSTAPRAPPPSSPPSAPSKWCKLPSRPAARSPEHAHRP